MHRRSRLQRLEMLAEIAFLWIAQAELAEPVVVLDHRQRSANVPRQDRDFHPVGGAPGRTRTCGNRRGAPCSHAEALRRGIGRIPREFVAIHISKTLFSRRGARKARGSSIRSSACLRASVSPESRGGASLGRRSSAICGSASTRSSPRDTSDRGCECTLRFRAGCSGAHASRRYAPARAAERPFRTRRCSRRNAAICCRVGGR